MNDASPNPLGIGEIHIVPKGRDAIHVAVASVVAGESLSADHHVRISGSDGRAYRYGGGGRKEDTVGVVDPFLSEVVELGQRFWLFLYPGTVTSLRHIWSHPTFSAFTSGELRTGHEARAWERNHVLAEQYGQKKGDVQ